MPRDLIENIPQNVGSCEGCIHAQPVVTRSEDIILECYRYPASIAVIDGEVYQVHPDAVYRCGEYRKSEEERRVMIKRKEDFHED